MLFCSRLLQKSKEGAAVNGMASERDKYHGEKILPRPGRQLLPGFIHLRLKGVGEELTMVMASSDELTEAQESALWTENTSPNPVFVSFKCVCETPQL